MITRNYNTPSALTLNEFLRNFAPPSPANAWRWIEKDDLWQGQLDLPGFTKEEVTVFIDKERVFTVQAKQTQPTEGESPDFPRSEINNKLRLPREADAEKLDATLENGVLNVTLPKMTPDSKIERHIELN